MDAAFVKSAKATSENKWYVAYTKIILKKTKHTIATIT